MNSHVYRSEVDRTGPDLEYTVRLEPIHIGDKTIGVTRPFPSELSFINKFELKYTPSHPPSLLWDAGTRFSDDFDRPMMRIDGIFQQLGIKNAKSY